MMLMKMFRPVILVSLVLAPLGISHAADMPVDCKLKGGTVVKLAAEVCNMEGGAQVNDAASSGSEIATGTVDEKPSENRPTGNAKLDEVQKWVVELLNRSVETTTPLNRNPEGIARKAKFDGCKLIVGEDLHIQYGNAFSVWKDFKINSVIDLGNISRDAFGVLGKVTSKGGELSGMAVYFEERKRKDGNNISISVLNLNEGSYTSYISYGLSAYWDTPRDDLWITDEFGYAKSAGLGAVNRDKIRILLIVGSSNEAGKLKDGLAEIHAMCRPE